MKKDKNSIGWHIPKFGAALAIFPLKRLAERDSKNLCYRLGKVLYQHKIARLSSWDN